MKKNERITALVRGLGVSAAPGLDPRYAGYFACFNAGEYYEAHDVLENLWLETRGADHLFYKGLIQIAGAFVHLQKQFLHPSHAKHGRRLRPAVRLFRLGIRNLASYGPRHRQLDLATLLAMCERCAAEIEGAGFERNPWKPSEAPRIELSVES